MKIHFYLNAFLIGFLVSGCQKDPTYLGETSPVPAIPWTPRCPVPKLITPPLSCSYATPLSPWELVDIGLENNPLTHNSWHLARAAAFNVRIQESNLYPTMTLQQTYQYTDVVAQDPQGPAIHAADTASGSGGAFGVLSPPVSSAGTTNASGGTSTATVPNQSRSVITEFFVSYLLLDFGGRQAQIDAAEQALLAANWTHNRTLQNVVITVLTAYYNHENAVGLLNAKEQDLKDSKTNLDAAQARFKSGVGTILDVLQAQSNYVNAELQVVSAQGQVETTHGQLAKAMGLPANASFTVEPLPSQLRLDAFDDDLASMMEVAKFERPDLAAAYSNFLEVRENIIINESAGRPTLTANGNIQETEFVHNSILNSTVYRAGITLNIPLFAGFLYENEVKQAREQAAAAFDQWKDLETTVLLDVYTSYFSYHTAVATLKFAEQYLKYSQEAYDAALATYKAGVGSFLDVLTSLTVLSDARAQWIQARTQLVTSIANVSYAMGTI